MLRVNTGSHVILNLLFQRKLIRKTTEANRVIAWGITGSLIPDIPMILFFLFVRFVQGADGEEIWNNLYFLPGWQGFFNVFNSIPLFLGGFLLLLHLKKFPACSFFLGGFLHSIQDFLLHHDDGHAHLWPFSNWVFSSPLSYWDPRYFGKVIAPLDFLMILIISQILWRGSGRRGKILLTAANLVNAVSLVGTYLYSHQAGI